MDQAGQSSKTDNNDQGTQYLVVLSNKMTVIVGTRLLIQADSLLENYESPFQLDSYPGQRKTELKEALDRLENTVFQNPEISDSVKQKVRHILRRKYTGTLRTKYDLTQPAELPPMRIELKLGAKPRRIRRTYKWYPKQKEFMRKLLAKLVNTGVISRTHSQWCCPVVLVVESDLTWRLCVDPSMLNRSTMPMI